MATRTPSVKPPNLAEKLERFFNLFEPTIKLAEDLIAARSNSQEVVLLLCARLDALASCTGREDQSNRQAFTHLLVNYAGHRDLMCSVSAGDLYYELGCHRWLAEGMIPKPGRLYRFSRLNDPIIHLLDRSGIPLTVEAVHRLLSRIMRCLAANFRCRPGQPLRKPMVAKPKVIIDKMKAAFQGQKDTELQGKLEVALQPLLDSKTVAGLLYQNFRNAAVHGVKIEFDEATFFQAQRPYWEPLCSEYYPPFLFVNFPGPFLIELLRNCVRTLRQKMLETEKLPPDVHLHTFGFDPNEYLSFLDEELLPKGRYLSFQK